MKSQKPNEQAPASPAKSAADLLLEEIAKRKDQKLRLRDVRTFEFPKCQATILRRSLKVSDVANATGLDDGQIRSAEKGENVRLHVGVTLANFYGKSVAEVFGDPVEVPREVIERREEQKKKKKAAQVPPTEPLPFADEKS